MKKIKTKDNAEFKKLTERVEKLESFNQTRWNWLKLKVEDGKKTEVKEKVIVDPPKGNKKYNSSVNES